ncbi:hypothetical protein tpqmel_0885 [Candidatus Gastranaerophilus sp. (ex Termes propinquus)]|nr:hypothetical protein tpqmel_0885 [Candidatus Gastranaerophilus sp. (ex Termes propinquus)]
MSIANVAPRITPHINNFGKKVLTSKPLEKANRLLEMNGVNFNPHVFLWGLMFGGVLAPRLIQAKKRCTGEGDEVREIFTRDLTSILTLTLGMKAIKGTIAGKAAKKDGLVLLAESTQGMSPLKKVANYIKPIGGLTALNSAQIKSKYSDFPSVEKFADFLKWIKAEGGDVKKILTFGAKNYGT